MQHPLIRARRFLVYSPGSYWGAIVCACLVPFFDLALLLLAGVYAHLLITRDTVEIAELLPWIQSSSGYLGFVLGAVLVAAVIRAGLHGTLHACATGAVMEASNRLRRAVYHHTYRLGRLAIRKLGPSEAVSIFTRDVGLIQDALYSWLTRGFREPVRLGLFVAAGLCLEWVVSERWPYLGLSLLLAGLLMWLVGGRWAVWFRTRGRLATRRAAEQLALLQESLMMMRLAKVYSMELFNQSRVERQLSEYSKATFKRYQNRALFRMAMALLALVLVLFLLGTGGLLVVRGSLGAASLVTQWLILASLYRPIVSWMEHRQTQRSARQAAEKLFEFLDRKPEVGQVADAEFLPPMKRSLEIEGVSLREPGNGRLLLQNVTLQIAAGQKAALVGADDLEKQALVYLLPRFLDPTTGSIRIDGKDIRWVTLESLRNQVALVLQHSLVFTDTVANNIGCGDPSFTLPQIMEAAKIAHAHKFIQELPRGYKTIIGDLGYPLSHSEQFRIALARAILRDPAVVVIEEPQEELEEQIKYLVDETYNRWLPGRTVIFLPHRVSTIRRCDVIFLIHKGRIVDAGSHRELLQRNELYRHLHYLEFGSVSEQASAG